MASPPAGAKWASFNDAPSGPVALSSSAGGVSTYDADIEPDADQDGRFRLKRRTRSLTAGRYRLDAAVLPASGPPGIATSRMFTVVR